MRSYRYPCALAAGMLLLSTLAARPQLLISEFMADNANGLLDEDGDRPDWIEIWNASTNATITTGWSLTDAAGNPRKWNFPTFTMAANERRVVFASNKDRRNPGGTLHTNFKLDADGEYLALVNPSGAVVSAFSPKYPAQAPNVSYGLVGGANATAQVVAAGAPMRWKVPANAGDFTANFGGWTNVAFNDSGWTQAFTGVGYDTESTTNNYLGLIGTNGNCQGATYKKNGSVMMRVPFVVTNAGAISAAWLAMRYEDGFFAWINGARIAADAAPTQAVWNALASANRSPESLVFTPTPFALTNAAMPFVTGTNVLTIQALNVTTDSSDLLALPDLYVVYSPYSLTNGYAYMVASTPGSNNVAGTTNLGPVFTSVSAVTHRPPGGAGSPDLVITAKVTATLRSISAVTLYHRIMYSNETTVAMSAVSSGVYVASIPTTNLLPGQMIRWRLAATDTIGASNTSPPFLDALDNDEYYGTIASDARTNASALPVFHWFVQSTAAADSAGGTWCSVYYLDRFYDHVGVNVHGQSSAGFPKKSHNFDFNQGNRFLWRDGEPEASDVDVMQNWGDKSKTHNTLAHEVLAQVGAGHHWCYPIRVEQNAAFYGTFDLLEDADERFLERIGYDPNDALYKMYNGASAVSGNVKKTREWEGTADLQALIDGLNPALALTNRQRYVYDNLDVPYSLGCFVGLVLSSSQDHLHKNYYFVRNTTDTGEWAILPWDTDLTWGRNWLDAGGYFTDTLYTTNSLDFYTPQQSKGSNRFYDFFFEAPEVRGMYLRRIRTCMDKVLQPSGTPYSERYLERRFDEFANLFDPPGSGTNSDQHLDYVKWGSWGTNNVEARAEIERTKSVYLNGRRAHLEGAVPTVRGTPIPPSQPTNMMLQFGALQVAPAGGVTQEYFTVVNTNAIYVDISGWQVTGAVTHTFRAGTVLPPPGTNVPNQGTLFVAKNARGFRGRTSGPGSNQYCFVQQGYSGQLSARGEALYLIDDTGRAVASTAWTGTPSVVQTGLRVTEVMYHPAPPTAAESNAIPWVLDQDFEYIEVRNISSNLIPLTNVKFTEGVSFNFQSGFFLLAGQRAVVVTSTNAFRLRYGTNAVIAGVVTGFLDNAGETIQLTDAIGELVQEFTYNNAWYPVTDGHGFSLVIRDEYADWNTWDLKASWRPSGNLGGNAGSADPGAPALPELIVNEVLAHTDLPQVDAIELCNPSATPADIGGWYLTDDFATPRKYKFPSNTTIGAWGHLFVDESHFNTPSNAPTSFRLSSVGDDVWLFSATASSTNLTGYALDRTFGASPNGVSFGRYVTSIGETPFVLQGTNSLGVTNGYPRVGPVVLAEILFQPPDLGTNNNERDEFIELANLSNASVPLHDPAIPTNTWRLRDAVDYDFPAGTSLGPTGRLLVVGFDPANTTNAAAFRATYGLSTNVTLYGPWSGKLANEGETIELKMPDPANSNEVPYVLVEQVKYRPASPWPTGAAGTGWSLHRIMGNEFGDDPINWFAGPATPSADAPYAQDTDADGQADWMEWLSGTDATNAASYLALIGPSQLTSTGMVLRWSGVAGRRYAIEVSTNLLGAPQFAPQTGNIPATLPDTTWTDVDATTNDVRVYRLRLER